VGAGSLAGEFDSQSDFQYIHSDDPWIAAEKYQLKQTGYLESTIEVSTLTSLCPSQ